MTTEPTLWDQPVGLYKGEAGHADADTSRAAAESIHEELGARQQAVLDVLIVYGPSTGEEIARRLGRPTYTVLPRLTELARAERIEDTGDRRPNTSGRRAIVWATN